MTTFGIEIEFAGDSDYLNTVLSRNGVSSEYGSYSTFRRGNWVCKEDGSVDNGGELVSPIFDFHNSRHREEVSRVLTICRDEANLGTTEQAGIHVHIGGLPLTQKLLQGIVRGAVRYEDFGYQLASSGWGKIRHNATSYARPFANDAKSMMFQSNFDWRSIINYAERYQMVNLTNAIACIRYEEQGFDYPPDHVKPTVEWRLFNTSLNPSRVQAYIAYAYGMVQAAALGRFDTPSLSFKNTFPVGGVATGKREPKALYNGMMSALGTMVLSPADRRLIAYHWHSGEAIQPFYSLRSY